MFPWIYEFHWSLGHIVFLSVFFTVVTLVLLSVVVASRRAARVISSGREDHSAWEAEFEDLPTAARVCRHQLTGEVTYRICHHGLDCRECAAHPSFLAASASPPGVSGEEVEVSGIRLPLDRYYHRGHTWVRHEGEGVYTIGLDGFAQRLIGTPDRLELPSPGACLHANGKGWMLTKRGSSIRILSPVDGTVLATGGVGDEWCLRVQGEESEQATCHLLRGTEVKPWILRELERLQSILAPEAIGASLADGGELLPDLWKQVPEVDWDGIWGALTLRA